MKFLQHNFAHFKAENETHYHNLNRSFCDAVHLNNTGNYKLYKSLHSVVIWVYVRQEHSTVSLASS